MTPLEFMYWLKGYFDITRSSTLEPINIDIIKQKMNEVIDNQKKTPTQFTLPTVWSQSYEYPIGT